MSKITQDELELLLTKAVVDPAFRELLKRAPREAAASLIQLDGDDIAFLATLATDLERFSRAPIDPIDAKRWAKGICYLRK
jgi:hypothetical protein